MIYYDPQQSVTASAVMNFKDTSFAKALYQPEFWTIMMMHVGFVALSSSGIMSAIAENAPGQSGRVQSEEEDMGEVLWESAATLQFFMTFFLTFYNEHCFKRYMTLYDECTHVMDGVLMFVHELTISLNVDELEPHRIMATKYVLAGVYIFFMTLTGGDLTRKEWGEIVKKGLLTTNEMDVMSQCAGDEITLILYNWAMQVVDDALAEDCMWKELDHAGSHMHSHKKNPGISHMHNRINVHITKVFESQHQVANIVALPIPFTYYHLMGTVLLINFFLFGFIMSLFKTFWTCVPFSMVLLLFMGLREVATQLADPFGQDDVDFPVAAFLNYTFESSFCLLEAFNKHEMDSLRASIETFEGFTDKQLMQAMDREKLYQQAGVTLNTMFQWHTATPFHNFDEEESAVEKVQGVLKPRWQDDATPHMMAAQLNVLHRQEVELRDKITVMNNEIVLLEEEDERRHDRRGLMEEMDGRAEIKDVAAPEPELAAPDPNVSAAAPLALPPGGGGRHGHSGAHPAHFRNFQDARSQINDVLHQVMTPRSRFAQRTGAPGAGLHVQPEHNVAVADGPAPLAEGAVAAPAAARSHFEDAQEKLRQVLGSLDTPDGPEQRGNGRRH